ncbi:hypothetical protein CI15_33270 [Paraburkholderia monticola]|uniref:HTH tetR-type domain-containing protein n=1 Tax=Paraburkholderia monticola TaxID=1399968 RepID=A0A149PBK6_9BURK|nr:hypothetical protein CI15_33270 [Paraburkholderia monticola]
MGDLRKSILEAAEVLFSREPIESMNLERLANRTGLGKRTLYRIFGPRKAFLQAYAEWLCDRERARWHEAAQRCGEEPVETMIELFIDIAVVLASDDHPPGPIQVLAIPSTDEKHALRLSRNNLVREFRALLLRLAVAANATDAEALAESLTTLWLGATSGFQSGGDSIRVAQHLPSLVDHIIKSYVPG